MESLKKIFSLIGIASCGILSLGNIKTIPSLIEALSDPAPYVQSEAMYSLEKMGKQVVPYLKNQDNWRAHYLLAKNGQKEIIPVLKKKIERTTHQEDKTELYTALVSLGFVGGKNEVAFILNLLKKISGIRVPAIMALHHIAKRDLDAFIGGIDPVHLEETPSRKILSDVIKNLHFSTNTLLSLLNHPDPRTKATALFVLRHIEARGIAPFFERGLASQNPAVQIQAVRGIADLRITALFPKLIEGISARFSPLARKVAIETLMESGNIPNQFEHQMLKWLNHADDDLRRLAIKALIQFESKGLNTFFEKALASHNPSIRKMAIEAMIRAESLLTPSIRNRLENQMLESIDDDDVVIRDLAIRALARLKSKKKISYLAKKIKDPDLHAETKRDLLNYIGFFAPASAEELIEPYFKNPILSIAAIQSLYQLKSEKTVSMLVALLKDKKTPSNAKLEAINYFISHRSPMTEEIIFPLLGDPDLTHAALQALVQLKPFYIENLLISYISHRSQPIKLLAVEELGKMKSQKSVSFLIQHLSYKDPLIQNAIIQSLTQIGDSRAVKPITLTLLVSRDETVIRSATQALAQLKAPLEGNRHLSHPR